MPLRWLRWCAHLAIKSSGSGRLPAEIVKAMKDAGVFGMATPLTWGGPELDPLTQFRVIEALAMADGSVGWCAMINCDSGYVTAFLDRILDAHCTQISSAHRRRRVHNRPSNPCARRLSREWTLPLL